jgi:hypothetical protein
MSELYPTDAELTALSGVSDPEQGVAYPAIGESPYYVSFYRMLYRLLDTARRAGDLRVYKDGDLSAGIRPGRFMDGDTPRQFAGAEELTLTNNATNAIYLTADGTPTVSTAGFPDPSAVAHLPLATITTAAGEYDFADIEDHRGRSLMTLLQRVTPARLDSDLRSAVPSVAISAGDESGDTRTVTMQLTDAAGDDLAARAKLRVWLAETEFAPPSATGNALAVTGGTVLRELTANADYELLTAADGSAGIDVTVTGAASRYVMAEVDGRVVSSGELTWSA